MTHLHVYPGNASTGKLISNVIPFNNREGSRSPKEYYGTDPVHSEQSTLSFGNYKSEFPNGRNVPRGESLDRKREYWTTNLIQMLRQEGIISRDEDPNFKSETTSLPFRLSHTVIRLIANDPGVYHIASFPNGVPGRRDIKGRTDFREPSSEESSPSQHHRSPVSPSRQLQRLYNDIKSIPYLQNEIIPQRSQKELQHQMASDGRILNEADNKERLQLRFGEVGGEIGGFGFTSYRR